MKIKTIYSILQGKKQTQIISVPNELIDKLKEFNSTKANEFLENKLKETICRKKNLDTFEVEICEFYEKKPKQKKPAQQQQMER